MSKKNKCTVEQSIEKVASRLIVLIFCFDIDWRKNNIQINKTLGNKILRAEQTYLVHFHLSHCLIPRKHIIFITHTPPMGYSDLTILNLFPFCPTETNSFHKTNTPATTIRNRNTKQNTESLYYFFIIYNLMRITKAYLAVFI